jgi:hypothetical protein
MTLRIFKKTEISFRGARSTGDQGITEVSRAMVYLRIMQQHVYSEVAAGITTHMSWVAAAFAHVFSQHLGLERHLGLR